MYICYSRLWKLLAEKGLTKSDLMEITGLSSRVIAKLSKNETVTTDTIAKICTALSCDVADIMECSSENTLSPKDGATRAQLAAILMRAATKECTE